MELTEEEINDFKEKRKIRNKRYYEKNREKCLESVKKHKYVAEPMECDICKCIVMKHGYRTHCMSNKHLANKAKLNDETK